MCSVHTSFSGWDKLLIGSPGHALHDSMRPGGLWLACMCLAEVEALPLPLLLSALSLLCMACSGWSQVVGNLQPLRSWCCNHRWGVPSIFARSSISTDIVVVVLLYLHWYHKVHVGRGCGIKQSTPSTLYTIYTTSTQTDMMARRRSWRTTMGLGGQWSYSVVTRTRLKVCCPSQERPGGHMVGRTLSTPDIAAQ